MKPFNVVLTSLLLPFCGGTVSCGQVLPEAKLTLVVRDEDGQPLEAAKAGMSFEVISGRSFESKTEGHHGLTDASGTFTASNPTVGLVMYGAGKEGYYDSNGYEYKFTKRELGRWEPYNVGFVLTLKKIVNPVPMYARERDVIDLPVLDEPVGYDLVVSDWVAPYGKGTTPDFIFKGHVRYVSRRDFDSVANLSFANPGDGIQEVKVKLNEGSALRLDRNAPLTGYSSQRVLSFHKVPGSSAVESETEDSNYYFRVRTVMRDGKIISALYGKIHGPLQVDSLNANTCELLFSYYLNPDGTPNVEFDTKRNLFTNLPNLEKARAP